jgi:hypothetical protein
MTGLITRLTINSGVLGTLAIALTALKGETITIIATSKTAIAVAVRTLTKEVIRRAVLALRPPHITIAVTAAPSTLPVTVLAHTKTNTTVQRLLTPTEGRTGVGGTDRPIRG